MTGAVVLFGVIGSLASILALWVKDPLLPEKMKERARKRSELNSLEAVAAELFKVVSRDAAEEVRNARDRLRVGWEPVEGDLSIAHLQALAKEADRWRDANSAKWRRALDRWSARTPLGGDENDFCDFLLSCVPTRRMLVVGRAGAGKSYLLNLIAYHWPKPEHRDDLVPVALSLTSWDPYALGLMDWIAQALPNVYPFLAAPSGEGHSWAAELVWRQRVLPLLDGLDEIAPGLHDEALRQINLVDDGFGLVVSCRTEDRQKLSRRWRSAVAVRPTDPTPDDARAFLSGSGFSLEAPRRWDGVIEALEPGRDERVRNELATPLMLDLARIVYNPGRGRHKPFMQEPVEMLKPASGETVSEFLLHWFIPAVYAKRDERQSNDLNRWTATQAAPWFVFLAGHLRSRAAAERAAEARSADGAGDAKGIWPARHWPLREIARSVRWLRRRGWRTPVTEIEFRREDDLAQDIEWWQLHHAGGRNLFGLLVGALCGSACGLAAALGANSGVGFGIDLGAGIGVALLVGHPLYERELGRDHETEGTGRGPGSDGEDERHPMPDDPFVLQPPVGLLRAAGQSMHATLEGVWLRIRDSPTSPMAGLAGGLTGGALGGLVAGIEVKLGLGHSSGISDSIAAGLGIGLASGPALGRLGGMVGAFCGALLAGPWVGVGVGLPAGLVNGLFAGLAVALIIIRAPAPTPTSRPAWRPVGLFGGAAAGLAVAAVAWVPAGGSLSAVLPYGLVVAVIAGVASGLVGHRVPRLEMSSPRASLRKDRTAFLVISGTAAIATGVTALALTGFDAEYEWHAHRLELHRLLAAGLVTGIAVGLTCGLVLAAVQSPWGQFVVTRAWLGLNRKLPLRLIAFLEEARSADRGVLRVSGPSYRFRHLELQQYLARRDPRNQVRELPGEHSQDEAAESAEQSVLTNEHRRRHHEHGQSQGGETPGPSQPPGVGGEKHGGGHVLARKVVERPVVPVDVPHDPAAPSGYPRWPRRIGRIEHEQDVAEEIGDQERKSHLRNITRRTQPDDQGDGQDRQERDVGDGHDRDERDPAIQ